jgi:hypothetical protein
MNVNPAVTLSPCIARVACEQAAQPLRIPERQRRKLARDNIAAHEQQADALRAGRPKTVRALTQAHVRTVSGALADVGDAIDHGILLPSPTSLGQRRHSAASLFIFRAPMPIFRAP